MVRSGKFGGGLLAGGSFGRPFISMKAKAKAKVIAALPRSQPLAAVRAGKSAGRPTSPGSFPIVGIGASAGGLEALEQFLVRVPVDSGWAIVIVQHLDPTRVDIMSELLQRATGMAVTQVRDCAAVQPNHVYVIPPNKDLSILHGVLHLLPPAAARGLRLPIDYFFRALAQDQRARSVGVILSGMGSDGTQGLRAIKAMGGLGLAQDPDTAKFDSMPRSAIDAGVAEIVAPVGELPARIAAHLAKQPQTAADDLPEAEPVSGPMEKIVLLLRTHTGNDFSCYKRNTLQRRIERRMGLHHIGKMANYVRYLQENPQEHGLLFREMLIGVTNFFRDPAVWEQLRTSALPALLATRVPGQCLRVWVPGCSTGEEAYSLAMIIQEVLGELRPPKEFTLQVFGTDLDRDAIDKARHGIFPLGITADVSPERLRRFFTREERGYRVRKEVRERVIFAPQNLIMDPPFTKLDLLSCRNLLIYLNAAVQKRLLPLFHYSLAPGGLLVLGSAETIGDRPDLFAPLPGKSRIFRRTVGAARPELAPFPAATQSPLPPGRVMPPPPSLSLQTQADQLVLQRFAPPAVLTNDQGDIFYVSGRTGKYLEPAAGKANWNLFAMAREGLRFELTNAFPKALRQAEPLVLPGLKLGTEAARPGVTVTLQRLSDPGPLQGLVLVAFTDETAAPAGVVSVAPAAGRGTRWAEIDRELQQARAEARSTQEAMQTTQEELRSANEELQSANEELQSTNEELTTSKEEMQSMNEELQMINSELQAKVDELSRSSNDMKNLLDSTDIATLFLDRDLNVRRFTPQTTKIIKLISADVGRPITDLASELRYPDLAADAREVLQKLASMEKTIPARARRWFTVRIMPYRTLDDRIDGVVITFVNITVAKTLEARLRRDQSGRPGLRSRDAKPAAPRVRTPAPPAI